MSDTTPPGNIWDTPDGRLLVVTCNMAQKAAIIEMMTAAYRRGFDEGWKEAQIASTEVLAKMFRRLNGLPEEPWEALSKINLQT